MVAWKATFLLSQSGLIKIKKGHIDFVDIVPLAADEVFHNDIQFAAAGQGKARSANEILCGGQIQFQRDGKGQCCGFEGMIVRIVADFGE